MDLRSLHYFVRIAELGSITRAAAHLQIAQPALTRHVQRLEDELDTPLFTRANRGVRLTEAGHRLLESAQRILRDVERAGDEIRAHAAHPSGKIVLGVTPTLCPVVVPELFARMRRNYPMIELKVVHAGTIRLEEFVVDGRVDIGLLAEIPRSRLIVSSRLAEEEMVLVTGRGVGLPGAISFDEVRRIPLILGDGLRAAMETLLDGQDIELNVETELNDHETIRLMVQQSVGASILPLSSVYRECVRGLAEAHRIGDNGVFRTLALGVAANRSTSSAREAVAEIVAQVISDIEAEGRLRLRFDIPVRAFGKEKGRADRRFTNPHLGKRQNVAATPADPDLLDGRRAEGNGRGRRRRGGNPSAQHSRREGQRVGGRGGSPAPG